MTQEQFKERLRQVAIAVLISGLMFAAAVAGHYLKNT